MRKVFIFLLILVIFVISIFIFYYIFNDKIQCESISDCKTNEACIGNKCVKSDIQCKVDSDCKADKKCIGNRCIIEILCEKDSECKANSLCIKNKCITAESQCNVDSECNANESCIGNKCVIENIEPEIQCYTDSDCPGKNAYCSNNQCIIPCGNDFECKNNNPNDIDVCANNQIGKRECQYFEIQRPQRDFICPGSQIGGFCYAEPLKCSNSYSDSMMTIRLLPSKRNIALGEDMNFIIHIENKMQRILKIQILDSTNKGNSNGFDYTIAFGNNAFSIINRPLSNTFEIPELSSVDITYGLRAETISIFDVSNQYSYHPLSLSLTKGSTNISYFWNSCGISVYNNSDNINCGEYKFTGKKGSLDQGKCINNIYYPNFVCSPGEKYFRPDLNQSYFCSGGVWISNNSRHLVSGNMKIYFIPLTNASYENTMQYTEGGINNFITHANSWFDSQEQEFFARTDFIQFSSEILPEIRVNNFDNLTSFSNILDLINNEIDLNIDNNIWTRDKYVILFPGTYLKYICSGHQTCAFPNNVAFVRYGTASGDINEEINIPTTIHELLHVYATASAFDIYCKLGEGMCGDAEKTYSNCMMNRGDNLALKLCHAADGMLWER